MFYNVLWSFFKWLEDFIFNDKILFLLFRGYISFLSNFWPTWRKSHEEWKIKKWTYMWLRWHHQTLQHLKIKSSLILNKRNFNGNKSTIWCRKKKKNFSSIVFFFYPIITILNFHQISKIHPPPSFCFLIFLNKFFFFCIQILRWIREKSIHTIKKCF